MSDEKSTRPTAQKPVRSTVQRLVHRCLPLLMGINGVALIAASAPAQLRIVDYNTTGGPAGRAHWSERAITEHGAMNEYAFPAHLIDEIKLR